MNHVDSPRTDDAGIEQQLAAKAFAPRVTPTDIQANIAAIHYFTARHGVEGEAASQGASILPEGLSPSLDVMTFCVLVLQNGFTVVGKSAPASTANFDAEMGRRIAYGDAVNACWPIMGYALKQDLWRASLPQMTEAALPPGQYRKRPVAIEAFQMTRERRLDNRDWPDWLNRAWSRAHDEEGAVFPVDFPNSDGTDELMIYTKEGLHRVTFDDWIIKGVKGELYSCKPDIFAATYEVPA